MESLPPNNFVKRSLYIIVLKSLLSLGNALLLALDMPILSKPIKHDMPESDEEAQRVAEEQVKRLCL